MVASVIPLPERADQKCMRWMESEGSSREPGDKQIPHLDILLMGKTVMQV